MKNIEYKILAVLALVALILRLYYASLDPFLHAWDERFHALVARNMMDRPFTPFLIKNPIVPYDLHAWCCNSIWLHKQPLFLWQMAASMKIFGVSPFAMRIPSAVMGSIMIFFMYRIAFLLTRDKVTGLLSSFLFCFSHYQLELIAGSLGMEHNDVAFSFYILGSIWAFSEYLKVKTWKWAILVGFLAGAAILNKWLTGLLIFLPWGLLALKHVVVKKDFDHFKKLLLSLLVCLAIFLPWQVYILQTFPELAMHEYTYNSKHIWEAVEDHVGTVYFYASRFPEYFGNYLYVLVILGVVYALYRWKDLSKDLNFTLLVCFFTIFSFFSFLVKSKLPTYFFIVAPIGMIYMSMAITSISRRVKHNGFWLIILPVVIFFSLNPMKSIESRKKDTAREGRIHNTKIYKSLSEKLPNDVKVVINLNSYENIDLMFFNNDITAYHWWFDVKHLDSLKAEKVKIAAFKNRGAYNLPKEFASYPYLYTIDEALK